MSHSNFHFSHDDMISWFTQLVSFFTQCKIEMILCCIMILRGQLIYPCVVRDNHFNWGEKLTCTLILIYSESWTIQFWVEGYITLYKWPSPAGNLTKPIMWYFLPAASVCKTGKQLVTFPENYRNSCHWKSRIAYAKLKNNFFKVQVKGLRNRKIILGVERLGF